MPPSAELLTFVVFLPAAGAILLAFLSPGDHRNLKATAVGISALNFFVSLALWSGFTVQNSGFQFAAKVPWIEPFGISYNIGIDGISLVLIVLTTLLVPLTLIGAWSQVEHRVKEFMICFLLLETGMLGAFVSLDLFLFYVFWEAMLIPMYFLIGIWGGSRRIYAAIKFFIFTMAGSLLMLIAIIIVAHQPDGSWNFGLDAALRRTFTPGQASLLFGAFALAFAIKVPMFPFHTWLPDAHVEAPTAGSVILAGVLLKLGVYGFIRFAYPIFPSEALVYAPVIGWLAVIGIIYGALVAWVQLDMKKLVAYSSISHLGFCMLGLAAMTVEAVSGAIFVMIAHGISTGALFLLVGVLYERRHTRILADYGGIAKRVPIFSFFFVMTAMASAGLPGLSGFPGEFMVMLGAFTKPGLAQAWAVIATIGVILAAVYLLFLVQKVLFGPMRNGANEKLTDMRPREIFVLGVLMALAVVLGLFPRIVLTRVEPAVQRFVVQVHQRADGPPYSPDAGALKSKKNAKLQPIDSPHFRRVVRPRRLVAPPDGFVPSKRFKNAPRPVPGRRNLGDSQ